MGAKIEISRLLWIGETLRRRITILEMMGVIEDGRKPLIRLPGDTKDFPFEVREADVSYRDRQKIFIRCPFCRTWQRAEGMIHWKDCSNEECLAKLHFSFNQKYFCAVGIAGWGKFRSQPESPLSE